MNYKDSNTFEIDYGNLKEYFLDILENYTKTEDKIILDSLNYMDSFIEFKTENKQFDGITQDIIDLI